MPYLSSKIPIIHTQYDRRRKLTDDQKEYIKWLREEEKLSYNKLAEMFSVSKKCIQFICNPDILENIGNVQRNLELMEDISTPRKNGQRRCANIGDINNN